MVTCDFRFYVFITFTRLLSSFAMLLFLHVLHNKYLRRINNKLVSFEDIPLKKNRTIFFKKYVKKCTIRMVYFTKFNAEIFKGLKYQI